MEAYKELSQEIGELKRLKDLQYTEPGGSKPSHAGKMKTRNPRGRHSHSDILGNEYRSKLFYCLWRQLDVCLYVYYRLGKVEVFCLLPRSCMDAYCLQNLILRLNRKLCNRNCMVLYKIVPALTQPP